MDGSAVARRMRNVRAEANRTRTASTADLAVHLFHDVLTVKPKEITALTRMLCSPSFVIINFGADYLVAVLSR